MRVRSFKLSDYISVTQLFREVLTEACYEETIEAFARQLSWDSELVLVALNPENEIVGVIVGTINENKGYYYRIAVATEHQRKGIGKQLIQSLKMRFLQRKVSKILVTVDLHNQVVLPLYEALGYRPVDFDHAAHRLKIVNG
jgi:ribosomal protein S18 acetylase RimI-like enzyme